MPTASDMARLGNMLVSAQHQRNAGVTGLRIETRELMSDLHDLSRARRRETQEHAAQTGRFVVQLHRMSRTRRRDMRRHAAGTGQFMGQLHGQTRARRKEMHGHAAQTGQFVGQLHDLTRARRRDVRRHAAQTADFVGHLQGLTREREQEVAQLMGDVQRFMAGFAAITKGGRNEWRRQQAAVRSARKTAAATGRRTVARARTGTASQSAGPMLTYIAEHPGTRLPQIEQALRINRLEAARTVHTLLDEGKIRRDKETRQYFPV
jgi:hypothetical protein